MIAAAGFNSYEHRRYLKDYFSGARTDSPAVGALFSVNPKTNDARISGSLASLCGLEKALQQNNQGFIDESVQKILMMQAHSFFLGGVPMIFYGDEMGYTNDYRYLQDPGKSYDNRWMHRPIIDWDKNARSKQEGSLEHRIFTGTQKLLDIRKALPVIADHKNLVWLSPHNEHVAGYLRSSATQQFFGVFNFSNSASYLTWYAFKEKGFKPSKLHDHWRGVTLDVGPDHEYLIMAPYSFYLLEVTE